MLYNSGSKELNIEEKQYYCSSQDYDSVHDESMKDIVEEHSGIDNSIEDRMYMSYTILVVDDDEGLSRLNQRKLQKAGFRTKGAFNGAEAIAWVVDNPDTIMLLDYKLPDMTGKQVVDELIKRKRSIPFIIITGHGDEKTAVEMMKLGAKDYLMKDESLLDLLPAVVKRVIDQITIKRKLITSEMEAKKKLVEKSKELEDFVYIVSHDLKEPLFAIEGFVKRLSKVCEATIDEKGKSYIKRIVANVNIMSKRIYEIMEVIKVGTVTYSLENNDSGAIVKDVVNAFESKIERSNIKLSISDNLPTVFCDRKRMVDVFSNLVNNSIKFMGDNKQREIKIGCNKDECCYKFFVEDTGIGISSEHQEGVFKIFTRLKYVEVEGTGVGLAIVKKIVELHNGKIWVESPVRNGRGSRFYFTIPITKNEEITGDLLKI